MQKYPLTMRSIHGVMALLIITLLIVGIWMADLPREDARLGFVYGMHKSFGVLALILILLRIINRLRSEIPALPREVTYLHAKMSAAVIFLLYLSMIAQPISGFLMSDFSGYPVYFFGIHLPSIVQKNLDIGKCFATVHKYLGYSMVILLALHIGGFLKHYLFDKVNLLKRIW